MRNIIKNLLLISYLFSCYGVFLTRIDELGSTINALLFIGLLLIVVVGLFSVAYIRNNPVRGIIGLLFFLSSLFCLSYQNITGDHLSYNSFVSLIDATAFAQEAIFQYYPAIVKPLIISLILLISVWMYPHCSVRLSSSILIGLPVIFFILLTSMLFIRGGDGAKGLPPVFTGLSYFSLAMYEAAKGVLGPRERVTIKRSNAEIDYDIILIIDESVSPFYLDINSKTGVSTSLKNLDERVAFYNYGIVASISNCSSEVNVTLRFGGTRQNYLSTINVKPSIWAYAKKAGLDTVYIDAQRTGTKLQNGMTEEETMLIDHFIQFDEVSVLNRDIAAADTLVKFIENNRQELIILNKIGAHFPVHDKFPDPYMLYKPVLPRGNFTNISDTGSRKGFSGNIDDWIRYRNSYRNTLSWNVGYFFKKLISESQLRNTVLLYTSDHGQDLHEMGESGLNTHCSSNPNAVEGMVPLLILDGSVGRSLDWGKYFNDNVKRSSHYNIFPTLLSLMKYDPQTILSLYGRSLHLRTDDPMTFNTNFHARLGESAKWKKIDSTDYPFARDKP